MNNNKYPDNIEQAYRLGALLDLRATISKQIIFYVVSSEKLSSAIEASILEEGKNTTPHAMAMLACDIANSLIDEWGSRGWISDAPTRDEVANHIGSLNKKVAEILK